MKSIQIFPKKFNFKAINNFPRLIIFLKRDDDKSPLSKKVAKQRVYDFPITALCNFFAFSLMISCI